MRERSPNSHKTRAAVEPCALTWCKTRHAAPIEDARWRLHTAASMTARMHGDRMFVRLSWSESLQSGVPSGEPKIVLSVTPDPEPGGNAEPVPGGAIELTRSQAGLLSRILTAASGFSGLADVLDAAVIALADAVDQADK